MSHPLLWLLPHASRSQPAAVPPFSCAGTPCCWAMHGIPRVTHRTHLGLQTQPTKHGFGSRVYFVASLMSPLCRREGTRASLPGTGATGLWASWDSCSCCHRWHQRGKWFLSAQRNSGRKIRESWYRVFQGLSLSRSSAC